MVGHLVENEDGEENQILFLRFLLQIVLIILAPQHLILLSLHLGILYYLCTVRICYKMSENTVNHVLYFKSQTSGHLKWAIGTFSPNHCGKYFVQMKHLAPREISNTEGCLRLLQTQKKEEGKKFRNLPLFIYIRIPFFLTCDVRGRISVCDEKSHFTFLLPEAFPECLDRLKGPTAPTAGVPKPQGFFMLCNGVGQRSFGTLERKLPIIKLCQSALASEPSAAVHWDFYRKLRMF